MFNLKVRITKFRIKKSQAVHGPGHVDLYLQFTLQAIGYMGAPARQVAVSQIFTDVPVTVTAILYVEPDT